MRPHVSRAELRAKVLAYYVECLRRGVAPDTTVIADRLGIFDRKMRMYVGGVLHAARKGVARLPAEAVVALPASIGIVERYVTSALAQAGRDLEARLRPDWRGEIAELRAWAKGELDALLSLLGQERPRVSSAPPTPVGALGPVVTTAGVAKAEPLLAQLVARLGPTWAATPMAVKDYEESTPALQAKVLRALRRVAELPAEAWPRKGKQMTHDVERFARWGTPWAFRVGKKVRLFVCRSGKNLTVAAIVARSDHRYYGSEA